MSGSPSVPAEVRAILTAAGGGSPIRPNTPVLPLESAFATASFIDPSVRIVDGKRQTIGRKDYIAPYATLDAGHGVIVIGSSSTIQDDARLIANPDHQSGLTGIFVGDNVVIGDGAVIRGPSAIGAKKGAATSIGPGALIDGAIIEPGAFVGALARVGPGVVVPTGFRVLPGANVTNDAQASTPSLGLVAKVTSTDPSAAGATREIANSVALASGYATLYQGNSSTGGAASAGPIPAPISAGGSTIFFGALNTVLGASSEPGSKNASFEPSSGTPTFLAADGTQKPLAVNLSYRFPARFIGAVSITDQGARSVQAALGRGDVIRADEGQPFKIGSIARLGDRVSIHSPGGGVQGSTTTTVVTTTTDTVTGVTTTTTTASTVTAFGTPTATAGTTTATTTGINASGHATSGMTKTTVAVKTTNLGAITIGQSFRAGNGAVIQGSPTSATTFGDGVTIGAGAVVIGSTIGNASTIGNRAYVANSTIPAGVFIPDGAIIVNNRIVGTVQR
jgi:carbonic anhydrase/acetyltransferase-like protein (isoleucine patch superfamily)